VLRRCRLGAEEPGRFVCVVVSVLEAGVFKVKLLLLFESDTFRMREGSGGGPMIMLVGWPMFDCELSVSGTWMIGWHSRWCW
jgi:hypothetical protein